MNVAINTNPEESDLVWSLAKVIAAGGIIVLVLWLSPVNPLDLLNWFLLVMLPIMLVLMALRVISVETVKVIWNQELKARVNARVEELRAHWQPEYV